MLLRMKAVDALTKEEKDLDVIVTPKTLALHHFYNDGYGQVPYIKFTKKKKSRGAAQSLKNALAKLSSKGKMDELPFGDNPYGDEVPSSVQSHPEHRPTASMLARDLPPPSSQVQKNHEKNKGKRTGEADAAKDAAPKKQRVQAEVGEDLVASSFGSLASENYKGDDVKLWSGRNDFEAEFSLRTALGETFFHGLRVLDARNAQISDLSKSVKKHRDSASNLRLQIKEIQKKKDEELKAKQQAVEALQATLDALSLEAKQASEASEKLISDLKVEVSALQDTARRDCSVAYSQGFLGYLRSFLAADPDYDWSKSFAPSTSGYMAKFKVENEKLIAEEKVKLEAKIRKELKIAAAAEKAKEEAPKETSQVEKDQDPEAPPSTVNEAS